MPRNIKIIITSLALSACASQGPSTPVATHLHLSPGMRFSLNQKSKISRRPAAETEHQIEADNKKEAHALAQGLPLLSEQMKIMQQVDAAFGKLKKAMDPAAYESLYKKMQAQNEENALKVSDEFIAAYTRAFPKEAASFKDLMVKLDNINSVLEKKDAEENMVTRDQIIAELKPLFVEISSGIPLGEKPNLEQVDAFLGAYYAKLTKKLENEKMNIGLAFGLGFQALEHMPEVNDDEITLEKYMAVYNKHMIPYLEKHAAKYKLQNFYGPTMAKFLREIGLK